MLRLDPFTVEHPATVDEAVALLALHGDRAKVLAGGTDLLPNMKHGLFEPEVVVSIGRLAELKGVVDDGAALRIGALTTLDALAAHPLVRAHVPGLGAAAGEVAGPQLRRMGTIGGNLCLDTRCLFYNQTYFWREALGFCLKKDGTVCHVVHGGKKCVAAASNDTATMLLCLDAAVVVRSAQGARTIPLVDFYVPDGIKNTVLQQGELLVSVVVPKGGPQRREGYAKLRHRRSIDYPLLCAGVRFDVDAAGAIVDARVTVSALGARPNRVNVDVVKGRPLNDAAVDEVARIAQSRCTPLKNIADDAAWRKEMVSVLVLQAAAQARARPAAAC